VTLPAALKTALEMRFGAVTEAAPVGGGSISAAARVTAGGERIFVKYGGREAPPGLFAAEAAGLEALRGRAGEIAVPRVLDVEDGDRGDPVATRWLALEWLEIAPPAPGYDELLGTGLATLHRAVGPAWGWQRSNFIGSLPQENGPLATWSHFWTARRLEPQLRLARDLGRAPGSSRDWERLFATLPELLAAAEDDGPSPLHGDLWSGNVLALTGGGAALVDPSFHHGHREVDLAMSELFGGFSARFRAAYDEAWPLRPGYGEVRRGVYQLYYLLVHVNLFGGGYGRQTEELLRRSLAAA
jgi:protein-ribulosamine 3-kinase